MKQSDWQPVAKGLNKLLSSIQNRQEWNEDYSRLVGGKEFLNMEQKYRLHRKELTKIATRMILLEQGKTPQQIKSEIDALNKELPSGRLMVDVSSEAASYGKKRKQSKKAKKSQKKGNKSKKAKKSQKKGNKSMKAKKSQKNKKSK